MAKKGQRAIIHLMCTVCQRQNYTTEKSKMNTKDKLELKKYCSFCKKRTLHKEVKE